MTMKKMIRRLGLIAAAFCCALLRAAPGGAQTAHLDTTLSAVGTQANVFGCQSNHNYEDLALCSAALGQDELGLPGQTPTLDIGGLFFFAANFGSDTRGTLRMDIDPKTGQPNVIPEWVSSSWLVVGSHAFRFSDANVSRTGARRRIFRWRPGSMPVMTDRTAGSPNGGPIPVKVIVYSSNAPPALAAPSGLTAVPSGSRAVSLSWNRQRGATGYEYQRKLRSSGDCGTSGYGSWRSTAGNAAAHTVSGLSTGRRYCFRVRAVAGRTKGAASGGVAATPAAAVSLVHPSAVYVPEGRSATIPVRLGARPAAAVTVEPVHPPAAAGDQERDPDIMLPATSTTLTFTPSNWSTEQTVLVTAREDADPLDGRTKLRFRVATSPAPPAAWAGVQGPVISVVELDDEFTATVTASPSPVAEGSSVTFTVTRDIARPQPVPAVLSFSSVGDTAESDDYSAVCRPDLVFAGSSRTASCTVATRHDADLDDETFTARLFHDDLLPLEAPSVTVTIEDDDTAGSNPEPTVPLTVSLSVAPNPTDEGQDVTVTATLSRTADVTQHVNLTLTPVTAETGGDDDYYHEFDPPDPLRIGAGNRTASTKIIVYSDADDDVDTFRVSLGAIEGGAAAGSPSSVLVTIEDDDAAGGAGGASVGRDTFAYWDSNRNGTLTCAEAARGLRLPAYPYAGDDPAFSGGDAGAAHETAVIQYWLEDPSAPDFGPKCESYSRPSGYVPCGRVYNPDRNEQGAFDECLRRSRGGADHDLPPVQTPVPALPAAAAAALAALLCGLGVGRSRRRRGCRLD